MQAMISKPGGERKDLKDKGRVVGEPTNLVGSVARHAGGHGNRFYLLHSPKKASMTRTPTLAAVLALCLIPPAAPHHPPPRTPETCLPRARRFPHRPPETGRAQVETQFQ